MSSGDGIREDLASLRDSIVLAVREERYEVVREGLDLYEDLVRTFVRRLADYGAHYDRREAVAEVSAFPGRGWPELSWIQEDYLEILRAAFRYPSQRILGRVLYFPTSVSSIALYEGEYLSFQEFALGVQEYAYRLATKLEDQDLQALAIERVWRFLLEFSTLMVSQRIEAAERAEDVDRIGEIAEGVLLIFNGLLKTAVDLRRLEDFKEFMLRMRQLFDDRQFGGSDFQEWRLRHRYSAASQVDSRAPNAPYEALGRVLGNLSKLERLIRFGLNGWICREYAGGKLDADAFKRWFEACGSFGDLAGLTKVYLEALDMSRQDLLRWEWWALEGTEGVVRIDVDGWFHRAYVLHALLDLGRSGTRADGSIALSWPKEWRFLIDRDSSALRATAKSVGDEVERWKPVLGEGVGEKVGQLTEILDNELARIEQEWRHQVVEAPLDVPRLTGFRDGLISGYQEGWTFRDLVWPRERRVLALPDEQTSKAALGYSWFLPKEYFVEGTNIVVGPFAEDLGRQLAGDVEQAALGRFVDQLQPVESSLVAVDVERLIEQHRKLGNSPSVLLLGSWGAYMDLYGQLEHDVDSPPAVGRFRGAAVYNLHFPRAGLILVGDLSRMGDWKQFAVNPIWESERLLDGELAFSLQIITREEAEREAETDAGTESDPSPTRVEDLLQKVRFRLFANADYKLIAPEAVACLKRAQPED